jgi:hypothetical protein
VPVLVNGAHKLQETSQRGFLRRLPDGEPTLGVWWPAGVVATSADGEQVSPTRLAAAERHDDDQVRLQGRAAVLALKMVARKCCGVETYALMRTAALLNRMLGFGACRMVAPSEFPSVPAPLCQRKKNCVLCTLQG